MGNHTVVGPHTPFVHVPGTLQDLKRPNLIEPGFIQQGLAQPMELNRRGQIAQQDSSRQQCVSR